MAKKIIHHPKKNDKVKRTFVAHGWAESAAHWVRGLLMKDDNVAYVGRTLHEPPFWAILFENVKVDVDEGYTLEVRDHQDAMTVTSIKVETPTYQMSITYPQQDANVCNSFYAYGTCDLAANVSGTISTASDSYPGITIQQPGTPGTTQGTWVIRFSGLPDNNAFSLTVTNTAGETAGPVTPIHVNSGNCL
jgi:hypothetical protein